MGEILQTPSKVNNSVKAANIQEIITLKYSGRKKAPLKKLCFPEIENKSVLKNGAGDLKSNARQVLSF